MKKFLTTAIASVGLVVAAQAHEPPGELLVAVNFPDAKRARHRRQRRRVGTRAPRSVRDFQRVLVLDPRLCRAENVDRGGLDASSMQIRHIMGWNDATNNVYITSRVFDNIHITQRQDPGKFFWDDSVEYELNAAPPSPRRPESRRRCHQL